MIQHRSSPLAPPPPRWAPAPLPAQRPAPQSAAQSARRPAGGAPHRYGLPPGHRPRTDFGAPPAYRPPVGFGPAPAGLGSHPAVPVPPVRIGPPVLWIALSWLLFGVLVVAGVAINVAETLEANPASGPERVFGSAEVTEVVLDPASKPIIYVAMTGSGYVTCAAVGPAAGALLVTPTTTDWSVIARGQEWHAAFELAPSARGTYQIRCEGPGATFGVGDQVDVTGQGDAAPALLVLPLIGLVTAVTTTIVVLVRRRAAQDRLFAASIPQVGPLARPW